MDCLQYWAFWPFIRIARMNRLADNTSKNWYPTRCLLARVEGYNIWILRRYTNPAPHTCRPLTAWVHTHIHTHNNLLGKYLHMCNLGYCPICDHYGSLLSWNCWNQNSVSFQLSWAWPYCEYCWRAKIPWCNQEIKISFLKAYKFLICFSDKNSYVGLNYGMYYGFRGQHYSPQC